VSELGWMPSRALGERHPGLLAVGGHPALDMPEHVVEAAAAAARRPAYAPTHGLAALREALAAELGSELGRSVDPETELLVTLGGMQGLHLVVSVFGAASVCHTPSFFFPQIVRRAGGRCLLAAGWEAYAAAVDSQTTLAIANTPVNPSGYVFRPADLEALAAALADSDCVLLSDEAYAGVVYDGHRHLSPASHPELAGRTIVLRSFSKTFGMAAWRVGYAYAPAALLEPLAQAFAWQSLALDGVAQAAALAALTGPRDWIERGVAELAEMRPRAVAAANATGLLRVELPEAAAFLWAAVEGDEEAWSELLASQFALPALPGRHFAAATPHLRIPFGGRRAAREGLLAALARLGERRDLPARAR
jgi:aspartate/methionine/tyrosine aminotransferase